MPRAVGVAVAAFLVLELLARALVASPAFHARIAWTDAGRRVAALQRWADGTSELSPGGSLRHDPVTGWLPVQRSERVIGASQDPAVVVLGDEQVAAPDLRDDVVLATRLAAATGGLRVRDLAVPGHGLDQQYLRLGQVHEARVVVVVLDAAMLARTTATWERWRKPRFEVVDGALRRVTPEPLPAPGAEPPLFPLRLIELGRVWLDAWRLAPEQLSRAPLTAALLDAVAARAAALDAALIVAWLPDPSPFLSEGPARMPPDLAAWCAAHACVDGKDAFRAAHRAGVPLATPRGHWSAEAHRVAAEVLAGPVAEALARLGG